MPKLKVRTFISIDMIIDTDRFTDPVDPKHYAEMADVEASDRITDLLINEEFDYIKESHIYDENGKRLKYKQSNPFPT